MSDTVDKDGCYPDRNCLHRNMAPPESCDRCYGRGYYPEGDADGYEIGSLYCECAAGRRRQQVESSG